MACFIILWYLLYSVDLEAAKSSGETEGSYISYVHHMTANQKLIKAKDLFYQLGFQKGVSKAEIEEAAVQQYKLAARKQVGHSKKLLGFTAAHFVLRSIMNRSFCAIFGLCV